MTPQQAFDTVVAGLASQQWKRSVVDDFANVLSTGCMYRGPGGLKCAVGHLIPDDQYNPEMENCLPSVLGNGKIAVGPKVVPALEGLSIYFLYDLQTAHDSSNTPEAMKAALRRVAAANSLQIPEELK